MLAGELYDPLDAELAHDRQRARELCRELNASAPDGVEQRRRVIAALFGTMTDVWLEPPFYCDYGSNISLGRKVFFNFNCVVLDVMPVRIGNHTLFGPAVQIYTAMHPVDADERRRGLEFAKPVVIGDDVWVGGAAVGRDALYRKGYLLQAAPSIPLISIGNLTVGGTGKTPVSAMIAGVIVVLTVLWR